MTDWKNSLNLLKRELEKFSIAGFLVGSRVYSKRFNKDSDVDLIVVIKDVSSWGNICDALHLDLNFFTESVKLIREGEAEYFCLKFPYSGVKYSLDILPVKFFKRIFLDISKRKTTTYHKVTNHPQMNSYEFGSGKKRLTIKKKNNTYKYCFTVSSPLCVVKDGAFYLGILLDKLITGYSPLWDSENFEEVLKKFIRAGAKSMTIQKDIINPKKVISSVNRFEKLPETHIAQIISLLEET